MAGRVAVNGTTLDTLGARADPALDEITVDGVPVIRERYRYVALHKPPGVLSTTRDERGRPTVTSLVESPDATLRPVGRLDQASDGLILLTNDGTLTELLTHPRHEVRKEYLVAIDQPLGRKGRERLVRGVWHEGERLKADSVQVVSPSGSPERPDPRWLLVALHGGRKREIRRMLALVGAARGDAAAHLHRSAGPGVAAAGRAPRPPAGGGAGAVRVGQAGGGAQ